MKPLFVALFTFMFAVGIGTLWEISEFAVDQLFGKDTQDGSLIDTMTDLTVDSIGVLAISIFGYSHLHSAKTNSFLARWIQRFIALNQRYFACK